MVARLLCIARGCAVTTAISCAADLEGGTGGRLAWPLGHEPDANQLVDAQAQACGAAARGRSAGHMMGTVRRVCRNVKRWRNAAMALRWPAAGMMEAAKGFRRLKAYKHLPALRAALAAHQSKYVTQRVEHDADAA